MTRADENLVAVVTWDWREQPNFAEIGAAIANGALIFVPVDSGCDAYAVLALRRAASAREVRRLWAAFLADRDGADPDPQQA